MELEQLDELITRALGAQREEEQDGYSVWSVEYRELVEAAEPNPFVVLRRVESRRHLDVGADVLHARLLGSVAGLTSSDRVKEVRRTLALWPSSDVVDWLAAALQESRQSDALMDLRKLAAHPASHVRFTVATALSACAGSLNEVLPELLALSSDLDMEVRWSAVFELAAWFGDDEHPLIRSRLEEVALHEPYALARQVAQVAIEDARQRTTAEGGAESED